MRRKYIPVGLLPRFMWISCVPGGSCLFSVGVRGLPSRFVRVVLVGAGWLFEYFALTVPSVVGFS